MESTGGSLQQSFGLGGFNVGGFNCQSGVDVNPVPGATIFAGRLTTPLFGLGLVDSLPDERFSTLASRQPPEIRGTVSVVTTLLPNPLDPSQVTGGTRVGRCCCDIQAQKIFINSIAISKQNFDSIIAFLSMENSLPIQRVLL